MVFKMISNLYDGGETKIVSVSKGLRSEFERVRIKGRITSLSRLFKMIAGLKFFCDNCTKITEIVFPFPVFVIKNGGEKCFHCNNFVKNVNASFVSAVAVEIQDLESFNDLDRLSVLLFNEATENVRAGETVIVEGRNIIDANNRGKGRRIFPYFYADSLSYDKNDKVVLTPKDIESIFRFSRLKANSIVGELVKMFDPSIIGQDLVKTGLLLCAVNSSADTNTNVPKRERIHAILIGPPGLAKTRLLKSATKIIPNSRFESGQSSSGKSLTAIVSKEDDNYTLRLGSVSLARNALCAINEFGRTTFEDQAQFLDVMEEGEYTINKHGINATIKAPTTIVVSANPTSNSNWNTDDSIDFNEIPALRPIIDRFDLTFVFRNSNEENEIREYAYKKSEFETKKSPDYSTYLIKHIEYARRLNPSISDEARLMLSEFFIKIKTQGFGSNRILDTLFRISKAYARLKLKTVVDENDAKETMGFFNFMLLNYRQVAKLPDSPRNLTYGECISTLKLVNSAITLDELLKTVCNKNELIKKYLCFGNKSIRLSDNKKVRNVYDMLLNHGKIKRIQEKPTVLCWIDDTSDSYDPSDETKSLTPCRDSQNINGEILRSYRSYGTETVYSGEDYETQESITKSRSVFECYYCDYFSDSQSDYERHVINKHPGKLCYPNEASLKAMGIASKGKRWEK